MPTTRSRGASPRPPSRSSCTSTASGPCPVLDPSGRQQVISCGIAVEFAVVALAARGLAAEVDLLPDGDASDHLATVRVTGPHETSDEDRSLAGAIDRRHTVRAPFLPQAVPGDLVDALQQEVARFDTWCKPITRSEEEVATVFLISRAEDIEQSDPAYVAELRALDAHRPRRRRRRAGGGGAERRSAGPPLELAHP